MKTVLLIGLTLLCGCVAVPPKRALLLPPPTTISLLEPLFLSSPLFRVKVLELPRGVYRQSYQNNAAIYYKTDSGEIRFEQNENSKLKSGGICYQKKDDRFYAYWEISNDERKKNEQLVAPGIAAIDSATQPVRRSIYGDTDNVERTFLAWIWDDAINKWKLE